MTPRDGTAAAPVTPRQGPAAAPEAPRLGFVGLGWIGGLRLEAVEDAGTAHVAALCDTDPARLTSAGERHRCATLHAGLDDLLREARLDGVVIATPNALHASQALAVLEGGLPLFVQKPLGLDRAEVGRVLDRARQRNRLVAVDYSYRHLRGAETLRDWTQRGELGDVHLVEAVFHNAYGPDKAWCFDPRLSGGGALLDLGVHLLDLAFWIFGATPPRRVEGWTRDLPGHPGIDQFAGADLVLDPGIRMRLTTSWHAHAGRDCELRVTLHGTRAAAELRNVQGSFYDFELVRRTGRSEEVVVSESREWMPRALLAWIERLAAGGRYESAAELSLATAEVVDRVYRRSAAAHGSVPRPRAAAS